MAWCRQATSHYLSQCWPRSLSPQFCVMGSVLQPEMLYGIQPWQRWYRPSCRLQTMYITHMALKVEQPAEPFATQHTWGVFNLGVHLADVFPEVWPVDEAPAKLALDLGLQCSRAQGQGQLQQGHHKVKVHSRARTRLAINYTVNQACHQFMCSAVHYIYIPWIVRQCQVGSLQLKHLWTIS